MRELVRLCVRGGTILDPFAGSGSTLAAAVLEDYNYIGIEKDTHYAEVAKQRVRETYGLRLFRGGV
jgi:site-specific DNA-methyltransferase (adenine-specific)